MDGAGDDPAVGLVGVERAGFAGSQPQGRGGLPRMGEPVQPFELLDAAVGAQLGEQAAPADTLELSRVADESKLATRCGRRG